MDRVQCQVLEFHKAFGITIGDSPAIRDGELRARLILEEAVETAVALVGSVKAHELVLEAASKIDTLNPSEPNLVEAIDGLCDVDYVVKGTAVALGVDLEPFGDEVHRSNMSKVGGAIREDGKRLKGPNYSPPDIASVLIREISYRVYVESMEKDPPPTIDKITALEWRAASPSYRRAFWDYWRNRRAVSALCLTCSFPTTRGVAMCEACK